MLDSSLLVEKLHEVREEFRPEIRERGINRNFRAYRFLLRELAQSLASESDYLDLGAGAGVIPLALSKCGLRVTVLDTWDEYCPENNNQMGHSEEFLSRFDRSGIQWIKWNLLSHPLPLASNSYDLVSLFDVLEHIPRPNLLIQEVHRLLRPGGVLVIKVPNTANLRNRLRLLWGKSPHPDPIEDWFSDRFFGHYREMTAAEFRRGLPRFGFEIADLKYSSSCHWNTPNSGKFDYRFRINSIRQFAKLTYFGATTIIPPFRYEILVTARKKGD
jgi:SAM-dependent methyltransferase